MANIFNPPTGDLGRSYGYLACLKDLQTYLANTTQYKPENRFVDAVPILEDLVKASDKLGEYFDTVKDDIPADIFWKS